MPPASFTSPPCSPTALPHPQVLVYNRRLGFLLLICDDSRLHMRTAGVASLAQVPLSSPQLAPI